MVFDGNQHRIGERSGLHPEIAEILLRSRFKHHVRLCSAVQPVVVEIIDYANRLEVEGDRGRCLQAIPLHHFSDQLELGADESHLIPIVLSDVVVANVLVTQIECHRILAPHGRHLGNGRVRMRHPRTVDISVEEPVHVNARIISKCIAKEFGSRCLVGILLEVLAHGSEEVFASHVIHHRVDNDRAALVNQNGVVSQIQRHVVERYPVA